MSAPDRSAPGRPEGPGTVLGIAPRAPGRVVLDAGGRPVRTDPRTGAVLFEATDDRLQGEVRRAHAEAAMADARDRLARWEALRPKDSREAGVVRAEPRVEVEVVAGRELDEDGTWRPTGRTAVEVRVFSLMSPGAFSRKLLPGAPGLVAVQVAAGACCEHSCESYGDPFDPDWAAHRAGELYPEAVAAYARGLGL